jgi:hypothetical protein
MVENTDEQLNDESTRGMPIRLTTNEWYKATQLGDSYRPYIVWEPVNSPDPEPVSVQNSVKYLDHAKKEVIAERYLYLPADAIDAAVQGGTRP